MRIEKKKQKKTTIEFFFSMRNSTTVHQYRCYIVAVTIISLGIFKKDAQLIYHDKNLYYEELLIKDCSVSIHHKNIH